MIDLKTVLATMRTGQTFSVAYVGADDKRKRYGHLIVLPQCKLLKFDAPTGTAIGNAAPGAASFNPARDPNHDEYETVNFETAGGEIRKCHIRLIYSFNGQKLV